MNNKNGDIKRAAKRIRINELNIFICICNTCLCGLNAFILHSQLITYIEIIILIITMTIFGYLIATE